jgi:hypothetical protein
MAAASAKKTEVRSVEERRETAVETNIRVQAAAITVRVFYVLSLSAHTNFVFYHRLEPRLNTR